MQNYAVNIENLNKTYRLYNKPSDRVKEALGFGKKQSKTFEALKDVSFNVKKGETVGIIGTNGAGKSTLLKIVTGVLSPTAGNIQIEGKVSALLELGAGFNEEYSGIENIYLNGRMMGYSRKEMDERLNGIVEFADIGDFINQPVKTYSSGMFARLAFAVAINVEPDILIVDEALSVGDIFFQNKCFKKFDEMALRFFLYLMISEVYARCVPEFYGLIMVRSEPLAKLRIFVICIWTKSENQQNMWPDIFRMKLQGMSSWKKLMKRENIPRSVLWRIVFTMTVWQSVLCFLQIPKIKR